LVVAVKFGQASGLIHFPPTDLTDGLILRIPVLPTKKTILLFQKRKSAVWSATFALYQEGRLAIVASSPTIPRIKAIKNTS
jgi:hypothetical protein